MQLVITSYVASMQVMQSSSKRLMQIIWVGWSHAVMYDQNNYMGQHVIIHTTAVILYYHAAAAAVFTYRQTCNYHGCTVWILVAIKLIINTAY